MDYSSLLMKFNKFSGFREFVWRSRGALRALNESRIILITEPNNPFFPLADSKCYRESVAIRYHD